MISAFVCLPRHVVYGTPILIVAYALLGLVAGLARVYVHLYTHADSKVKPVLKTNIMTRIVN